MAYIIDGEEYETVTDAIRWEMTAGERPMTQLQALGYVIRDACVYGHKFCTSDGHPIPLSSYLPRKGDPLGTQF